MAPSCRFVPRRVLVVVVLASALPAGVRAAQPKEGGSDLDQKAFFKPELSISTAHTPLAGALTRLPNRAAWESLLAARGDDLREPRLKAWLDPRSGAATNVMGAFPLIPGRGEGNRLTLRDLAATLGRPVAVVDEQAVAEAMRGFEGERRSLAGQHPAGVRRHPRS